MLNEAGSVYDGEYNQDNQKHGKGTIRYIDGSTYTGTWNCDKRQGQGEYRSNDGTIYTGNWSNDQKHG